MKVVGNDLTLPMSAKCGFFTAPLIFSVDELLFMFVMIKTHLILPSRYFLSLFVLFQVITVGAGRRVHHGNCWCKYTLLHSNTNEKKAVRQRGSITYSVAASGSIHYQMQITVTHTDKSSLFSFFKHNRQLRGWVFFWFFYTGCCWLDGCLVGFPHCFFVVLFSKASNFNFWENKTSNKAGR